MMMMKMTAPDATPANRATSDLADPTDSPLFPPDSPFCAESGERERVYDQMWFILHWVKTQSGNYLTS